MAQTAAQKAAATALKQAQALLAKQKKSLANLESDLEILDPTSTRVNTNTLEGINAASQSGLNSEDRYFRNKVGTTGKTQGQLDAAAGAADVAKSIGGTIDPKTGYVVKPGMASGVDADGDGIPDKGKPKEISDSTRDAFAMLEDLFRSYGLEGLSGEISGYMTSGFTASEALIKLKTNPTGAYAKRFAGNFTRVKNGLNAISEAEYISNENSYAETLKAYGLGNMVSLNREDNYKKFAEYIAGDVSPVEFKDRIDTVVTRVNNADPAIKETLRAFYPEISDSDLVGYFLNPKDNILKLKEKVTASEIGAAAVGAGSGLTTNVGTATDLARYGVDQATARQGYSVIADVLPTATKLGDIYNETGVRYGQAEGEAEVFKGNQDAATKRKRLASLERAAFAGSSGLSKGALSSGNTKSSATAGLI
jgi:hypothetical protein